MKGFTLFSCRLLHLFLTIIYNLFILRPVEVMVGWIRTVVIFFGSGIAGSLASAIFLPYLVSVSKCPHIRIMEPIFYNQCILRAHSHAAIAIAKAIVKAKLQI